MDAVILGPDSGEICPCACPCAAVDLAHTDTLEEFLQHVKVRPAPTVECLEVISGHVSQFPWLVVVHASYDG